ncbi:hypothetical protein UlMin_016074 [Ulmus minor]
MEWIKGPLIGRGATATVSLAAGVPSGELFAVKSTELSSSKLLQTEQSFLSKLASPYVIKYMGFDIGIENNQPFYNLFLEYLPRGTLSDEIRSQGGKLSETQIRKHTWQILQGLDYLHSKGIVHCDIKSSNILMGKKETKIADLGCAKFVQKASGNGDSTTVKLSGTPLFMAPEVVLGEEQGFEADIWALGCTIIEMATGENPWIDVNDPISALYRIGFSSDLPEFPSCLSEKGKDFLSFCLKRDPKQRMTAKELLKHPFLEEIGSKSEELEEFFICSSPNSVFDRSVWDSFEVLESPLDLPSHGSSAASRIERLIRSSVLEPNWTWDDDWISVRSYDNDTMSFDNFSDSNVNGMSFLDVHQEELQVFEVVNTIRSSSFRSESVKSYDIAFNKNSIFSFNIGVYIIPIYFLSFSISVFGVYIYFLSFSWKICLHFPRIPIPISLNLDNGNDFSELV